MGVGERSDGGVSGEAAAAPRLAADRSTVATCPCGNTLQCVMGTRYTHSEFNCDFDCGAVIAASDERWSCALHAVLGEGLV